MNKEEIELDLELDDEVENSKNEENFDIQLKIEENTPKIKDNEKNNIELEYEQYLKNLEEILKNTKLTPATDKEVENIIKNELNKTNENVFYDEKINQEKEKEVIELFYKLEFLLKKLKIEIKKIDYKDIKIEFNSKDLYNEKFKYYNIILKNKETNKEIDLVIEPVIIELIISDLNNKKLDNKSINRKIKTLEKNNFELTERTRNKFKKLIIEMFKDKNWNIIKECLILDLEPKEYELYQIETNIGLISNFFVRENNSNIQEENNYLNKELNYKSRLEKIKRIIETSELEGTLSNFYLKINKYNIKKLKNLLDLKV